MKENDLRYSEKIKFNKEQVKKIVEQENFDVCINLDGCDLIKVDNWILEQIRNKKVLNHQQYKPLVKYLFTNLRVLNLS